MAVRNGRPVVHISFGLRTYLFGLAVTCAPAATHADYTDCRTCHYAPAPDSTTPDYTNYFIATGHHPVRVNYPAVGDYNQPPNVLNGIQFWDLNGNGLPDPDEIQLFSSTLTGTTTTTTTRTKGSKGPKTTAVNETWTIDCASCHTEHGTTAPNPSHPADYVRPAGGDRWLCLTCHRL